MKRSVALCGAKVYGGFIFLTWWKQQRQKKKKFVGVEKTRLTVTLLPPKSVRPHPVQGGVMDRFVLIGAKTTTNFCESSVVD